MSTLTFLILGFLYFLIMALGIATIIFIYQDIRKTLKRENDYDARKAYNERHYML